MKTIIQLDESSNYLNNLLAISPNSSGLFSSFIINNVQCALTPANYSTAQILPYHYSEYEQIFVCNLCNCTYDSVRSIKAHLWKHSGHHELSYPIHNNRSNLVKYLVKIEFSLNLLTSFKLNSSESR